MKLRLNHSTVMLCAIALTAWLPCPSQAQPGQRFQLFVSNERSADVTIIDPATLDALCIGKGITPVSVTTIPAEPTAARMTLYHVTKSGLALLLDRLPQRAERARLRRQAEKIII